MNGKKICQQNQTCTFKRYPSGSSRKSKNENLSFLEGVRLGTFTVPGDGCIDFDPIFKVLEDAGYEGYMLVEAEQDPAKANPLEYAIKARKFIAEKTGL